MPTLQVRVWAEKTGIGVGQWAAETMGIWQDKGGLATQRIDHKVRDHISEIKSQSWSIINRQGACTYHFDLLVDRCVTPISHVESKRLLSTRYMADKTNPDCQILKAALDWFVEVGLRLYRKMLKATLTKKRKLVHVGMYSIAPMHILLFLIMVWSRRWGGRNLGPQEFTNKGAIQQLDLFPCSAI